jgi:hypothetical protein
MDSTYYLKIIKGAVFDSLGKPLLHVSAGDLVATTHKMQNYVYTSGGAWVLASECIKMNGWNKYTFDVNAELKEGESYRIHGQCSVTTDELTNDIVDYLDEMADAHFEADGYYRLHITDMQVIHQPECMSNTM